MKRVAMIVLSQYPGDPRVRREAEALERRDIPIDIICYRNPDQMPVEQLGKIRVHRIMTVRDKTNLLRYLFFSLGFGLMAFFKLVALTLRTRFAVVQIHNMPDQLVFTASLHRLFGVPVVLDLHDLMVELFEAKWSQKSARRLLPLVKFVERLSCAFASRLITTSIGFRDKLVSRGIPADKVTLVLNSADENIFFRPTDGPMGREERRGRQLSEPRLIYTGTVAHRFGIHVMIAAVEKLVAAGMNPRLRIFGKYDADYKRVLEDQIEASKLEDNVQLGGYLTHEEIREVLADSDIGIVPYLSDSFMELALSTKAFEYVAMALPVVSSRVASMTSIFDDEALRFFTPGDDGDLARQISFFCEQPEAREAYPARADAQYADMAWPVMESRYVDLMTSLM